MIRFEDATYAYPRQTAPAIRHFTWAVEPGTFAVVSGPSGAGKSTIARCLTGLVPHFHGGAFGGRVVVAGLDTREIRPARLGRLVGFVAQDPETQTVMDRVEDEIAFGPENHGLSRRDIRLRVEEVLDVLGISALRRRELATLSGGERQRAVLAAALAMRPDILVLDEPTSQLDPWAAEEVLTIVQRLNRELGTTVVLVEHRLDRVLGAADRLLVLHQGGSIAADAAPREAVSALPDPPPLLRVGEALGWHPLPLTVRDARRALAAMHAAPSATPPPATPSPTRRPIAVSLEHVTFAYDDQVVLRDVSAEFEAGTVSALLGRNGAGKTTLLKLINGLLRPRSGRVRVHGDDVAGIPTARLAHVVGYLPQNPGTLLFHDTVEAELRFTLRAQGRTGDVAGSLDAVGLADLARRSPLDLSSGQRQRAALASVLVARPSVLLLDEPTRGMDPHWQEELAALLRRLAAEGTAVLIATHDVDLIAECADRVLLLADGEVAADGPPKLVLAGSLAYSTQINRVFGGQVLRPADVLSRADRQVAASPTTAAGG